MGRFYQKTWFIILMLILLFPVGIFLMWKYTGWNKVVKIIVTVVICFFAYIFWAAPNDADHKGNVAEKESISAKDEIESNEEVSTLTKEEAKEIDREIWGALLSSEKIHQQLTDAISKSASGEIDDLTMYDTCKSVKNAQSIFAFPKAENEESKDYLRACETYSAKSFSIADSLLDYFDKKEMKYLSKAKEDLEQMDRVTLSVVSERTKFLELAGYTSEEISEIISQEAE